MPRLGIGIGIPLQRGGVSDATPTPFPDNISDPIEKAIVEELSISEAEYNANGISNSVNAWWGADENVTGIANVTAWMDKSGNNITVTPNGDGADGPPSLITNVELNAPSVEWDDANVQGLSIGQNIISGDSDRTVIALVVRKDIGSGQRVFIEGDVENFQNGEIFILSNEPGIRVGGGWKDFDLVVPNAVELISTVLDGDNVTDIAMYIDGVELTADSTSGQPINTAGNLITLGEEDFVGEIIELIMIPQALTNVQREAIEGAIETKYGITL